VQHEIVVLPAAGAAAIDRARQPDPFPGQENPDRRHPACGAQPAPRRQAGAVPAGPVGEQQDVAAFFPHHRFEGIDQRLRKQAGAARKFEQAEGKEAVDAFVVAGDESVHGLRVHAASCAG